MHGHTYSKSMDQPGKVANPACGQLSTGEMNIFLSGFAPDNLVSRDGFGSPVPRQPAYLHTQAKSGAYSRDSSRVPRRHPFIYFKPPYAIGSIPSLSGRAIAYRWRSLPRVHRQVTMDRMSAALASHHGPINMRLSFPYLLLV